MSDTTVPADRPFDTIQLRDEFDYLAPDGSEIRLLVRGDHGSLTHCTLPPGTTTRAVRHKGVEELWYVLAGAGEVRRGQGENARVVDVSGGTSLDIPPGVPFQFRNTGDEPLELVIATVPPWPGADEAVRVDDHWSPSD